MAKFINNIVLGVNKVQSAPVAYKLASFAVVITCVLSSGTCGVGPGPM